MQMGMLQALCWEPHKCTDTHYLGHTQAHAHKHTYIYVHINSNILYVHRSFPL